MLDAGVARGQQHALVVALPAALLVLGATQPIHQLGVELLQELERLVVVACGAGEADAELLHQCCDDALAERGVALQAPATQFVLRGEQVACEGADTFVHDVLSFAWGCCAVAVLVI